MVDYICIHTRIHIRPSKSSAKSDRVGNGVLLGFRHRLQCIKFDGFKLLVS
jgi:hypothetical protein